MISPEEFISHVLPHEGWVVCASKAGKKFHHQYFPSAKDAVGWLAVQSDKTDVYIAAASYQKTDEEMGLGRGEGRTQENVRSVQSFWLDIDAGEKKPYRDAAAARDALLAFCKKTGLPIPTMVNSGGGIHTWWTLTTPLEPEQWKDIAERLKRLIRDHGLDTDPARTADCASLMRVPGTWNRKLPERRSVQCEALAPAIDLAAFLACLPDRRDTSVMAKAIAMQATGAGQDRILAHANLIADGCNQMKVFRDTRGNVDEPAWYAGLCLLVHCHDADAIGHSWSEGHPNYRVEETDRKLMHARESNTGPTTCALFEDRNPGGCSGCPHRGNITSPIQLGQPEPIPEPPRPLRRKIPEAQPYPVEALGPLLEPAARAIHDKTQAPMAICGQSVLAAAALAGQGYADLQLPTGEVRPLSLFLITVAESGERKSAVDDLALAPIVHWEGQLREKYEAALPEYKNRLDAWTREREIILRDKKNSFILKQEKLRELGPEPMAPLIPMLTCPEPTFEGLCKFLEKGHPSQGIFSAEGGQFIGGHGMKDDNRLKTAAGLSSCWDGQPIRRVRVGDGVQYLPGRRLSLHIMVQPGAASRLLSDEGLADQGLLSRMLVVSPPSASGTRFWKACNHTSDAAISDYRQRLLSIISSPLRVKSDKPGELTPRRLPLCRESVEIWTAFADEMERQIGPDGRLAMVKALTNKLPQHAARIAAVLEMLDNPDALEVSAEHMSRGTTLARYYAEEALRLVALGMVDPLIALGETVLTWLLKPERGDVISLPDLYMRGPTAVRDQFVAKKIVGLLQDHGHLTLIEAGAMVNGTRRRQVWKINRV